MMIPPSVHIYFFLQMLDSESLPMGVEMYCYHEEDLPKEDLYLKGQLVLFC